MKTNPTRKIAIVGAGPAGLMAAEVLSNFAENEIHIFEQKPSAARKFLMAGKTGLNISHAESIEQFITRYDRKDWLSPWVRKWDAKWIQDWMKSLGIDSYVGSSGRIFPNEMKAAPLLRAWLKRLIEAKVKFYYRHQVESLKDNQLIIRDLKNDQAIDLTFDAIILACGAISWSQLGSDGAWQQWLSNEEVKDFEPSNAGVLKNWSRFMESTFGMPLKRVAAWVNPNEKSVGDIVISHYGLESGLVYKHSRVLREQYKSQGFMQLNLDLLPEISIDEIISRLSVSKKQSTNNVWRKLGLDTAKSNLLRELVSKEHWNDALYMANAIKHLVVKLEGFRPIEEAISCAGGIKQTALNEKLQLKSNPYVFCCGEMLDWDAPTGGYLLTACFATGRAAAEGVIQNFNN